jgi:hypothetical protein
MKPMKETTTTPPAEPTPAAAPPLILRVRVLKNGLEIAGGIAAAGAVLNCAEAAAKFHEDRGEAEIVGTL